MKIENYMNAIIFVLTIIGFVIGFLNESYRLLSWSISFIVISILVLFLVFRDYISQIDNNAQQIEIIKKDLNIINRLSKLEGQFEMLEKRIK